MTNVNPTKEQFKLFARHSDYISKIKEYEKRNEPLNQNKLGKELNVTKARVGVVCEKLEKNGLIKREHKKKYQQRGGKSNFLFLNPIAEKLYNDYHSTITDKVESKTKTDTSKINVYIDQFNNTNKDRVRNLAIYGLYRKISNLLRMDLTIEWRLEKNLTNFINSTLSKLNEYDNTTQNRLFSILEMLYNKGYYDSKNFDIFSKYIKKCELSNETYLIINLILSVLIIAINNEPLIDSKHYSLFIKLLNKLGDSDLNKFYSISNNKDVLRNLPIEMKDHLENELFEIVGSFKDSDGTKTRSINEEILSVLNQ